MKPQERAEVLPDELLWTTNGHASDIALTALADGELEIVAASVMAHVKTCGTCHKHLGNAALLSLHTGRELEHLSPLPLKATRPQEETRPLPRLAIALGLLVAALGLVANLATSPPTASELTTFATHDIPILASGLRLLWRHLDAPESAIGVGLPYFVASLLLLTALALVHFLPKKEFSQ
jgi:hypothetical protein